MDFKEELIAILHKETKISAEELANLVVTPPDPKLGDYAFPCFRLGKNAKEEADKLKGKLKLPDFVAKVEVVALSEFLYQAPPSGKRNIAFHLQTSQEIWTAR